MSQSQEVMECSICLDCIDGAKNQVITECGHCFHVSCLMKNVSHNGFACPYCRTIMAEAQPNGDGDDESDYSEYTDVEDDMYDDYSLRGMRWMFQRAEGEDLDDDADDEIEGEAPNAVARLEEREEGEVEEDSDEDEEEQEPAVPTAEFIAYKLVRGRVTMEMLVKAMLALDHDEYADNREYNEMESNIFGRLRTIISNYRPEDQEDMERNVAARRARELEQQQAQAQPINQLGVFGRGVSEV